MTTYRKIYKEEITEQFVRRDFITGRRKFNEINRKHIGERERDMIFNEWVYEAGSIENVDDSLAI